MIYLFYWGLLCDKVGGGWYLDTVRCLLETKCPDLSLEKSSTYEYSLLQSSKWTFWGNPWKISQNTCRKELTKSLMSCCIYLVILSLISQTRSQGIDRFYIQNTNQKTVSVLLIYNTQQPFGYTTCTTVDLYFIQYIYWWCFRFLYSGQVCRFQGNASLCKLILQVLNKKARETISTTQHFLFFLNTKSKSPKARLCKRSVSVPRFIS